MEYTSPQNLNVASGQDFSENLKASAKQIADIELTDVAVEMSEIETKRIEDKYQWFMPDWSIPTNEWMQLCTCAEERTNTAFCNHYQDGKLHGQISDDQCSGAKPSITHTCPCPDTRGVTHSFNTPIWNPSWSAWANSCTCGDVREVPRSCSTYQNDQLVSTNVAEDLCYFSMEMEGATVPEYEQVCNNVCDPQ